MQFDSAVYLAATCYLLVNANLISSSVYRADILYDSSGILADASSRPDVVAADHGSPHGYTLTRTVVRKFIPRNTNLDRPLEQTCRFYDRQDDQNLNRRAHLVTYESHVSSEDELPYYHPALRAWAVLYEFNNEKEESRDGIMSLHFASFHSEIPDSMPNRFHRILLNLLDTTVKVTRQSSKSPDPTGTNSKPFKDNLVPQQAVQSTHSRLKMKYAKPLMQNWVEQTEPSKHVFEDIAIAAFLIELWKTMYQMDDETPSLDGPKPAFPGFLDIACGNGVLVYILLSEGYNGRGFDAHRRKTWSIFPPSIQEQLTESICVPQPFKTALSHLPESDTRFNFGSFPKGTFIISNHADELTIWTPLLGALSNPNSPLPFLAIPCCSHSISGTRHRYPPPTPPSKANDSEVPPEPETRNVEHDTHELVLGPTGDLRALRALRIQARQNPGSLSSAYGTLTAKVINIAEEIGYDVESTILRIPSTRNIGIVGKGLREEMQSDKLNGGADVHIGLKVQNVLERETIREGGLQAAARVWVEHSLSLQKGQGKGRVKGERHHD